MIEIIKCIAAGIVVITLFILFVYVTSYTFGYAKQLGKEDAHYSKLRKQFSEKVNEHYDNAKR